MKKLMLTVLSVMAAVSLVCGLLFVSAEEPVNLALDQSKWTVTTHEYQEGGAAFDAANGITLSKWASNAGVGVYLNEKIPGKTGELKVEFKGKSTSANNGSILSVILQTELKTSRITPFGNDAGGKSIMYDNFKFGGSAPTARTRVYNTGSWDQPETLTTKNVAFLLDETEHTMIVQIADTDAGSALKIYFDDVLTVDQEVPGFQGGMYFGMGMYAFDTAATPGEGDYLSISSVTVSGEQSDVVEPPKNYDDSLLIDYAKDASMWSKADTPVDGGITFASDKITINKWGEADGNNGLYFNRAMGSESKISFKYNSTATADTAETLHIQIATGKAARKSLYNYKNTENVLPTDRALLIEFRPGWIEIWEKQQGNYDVNLDVKNPIVQGNNGVATPGAGGNAYQTGEHTVVLTTKDTETGVHVTMTVDEVKILDHDIEDTDFRGNKYFAFGMTAAAASAAGEKVDLTSFRFESEGAAFDVIEGDIREDDWGTLLSSYPDAIAFTDTNTARIGHWGYDSHAAGIYYNHTFKPESSFEFTFTGNFDPGYRVEDAITDPANYWSYGSYFYIVLEKSAKTDAASIHPWKCTPGSGQSILLEFRRTVGGATRTEVELSRIANGSYSNQDGEKFDRFPADYVTENKFDIATNLFDGKSHTIKVETAETDTGISIYVLVDGKEFAKNNLVGASLKGYYHVKLGCNYNWTVGALEKSHDSEYVEISSFTATGLGEPVHQLEVNSEFAVEQSYLAKEEIRLNLNNMFLNVGNYPLTFTAVRVGDGQAVGTVSDDGFWSYTPQGEENFVLRVTAHGEVEGLADKATIHTINVLANDDPAGPVDPEPSDPEDPASGEDTGKKGCGCGKNSAATAIPVAAALAAAAIALVKRK